MAEGLRRGREDHGDRRWEMMYFFIQGRHQTSFAAAWTREDGHARSQDVEIVRLPMTTPGKSTVPVGTSDTRRLHHVADRMLEPHVFAPLLGALAVTIALVVVHEISGRVHLDDIRVALSHAPVSAIACALALTTVSFSAMSLYDMLAVRRVAPDRVPPRLAAFAGFVGYGFSTAIGFHVFVGGPIRYRIYHTAGLDGADVGRIVGISVLTFAGGLVTILGVALLVDPAGVPALHALSPSADRILGLLLLLAMAGAIAWLALGHRQLSLFGWSFPLPTAPSALAQIAVGAADVGAAAGALYLLLPADIAPGFAAFLLIFVAAVVASAVSHAPGGLGVLEATVLLGLGAGTRSDVIAALLIFRVVYYFVPLAVAASCLAAFEAIRARTAIQSASARVAVLRLRLAPPAAAALTLAGGFVLLVSGATPTPGNRAALLAHGLPLPFAEASHVLASLTGLVLVVIARGLYRRIALARIAAIALLLAGAAFSLLKGLDWAEALTLCLLAGLLSVSGDAFYRESNWRAMRPTSRWLALILIMIASATLIGLLAYRHVDYRDALWWRFAWDGDAPRFIRATLALAVATAAIAFDALVNRPAQPRPGKVAIPPAVRRILQTSPGTQPCVALLGDKAFLVSSDEGAFLMYQVHGQSWIAMGDPVGEAAAARALIWRFAETADRAGGRVVFYAVQPEYLSTYLDLGLAVLKIGEVARVDLASFSLDGAARQPLRYAAHRARREGLGFSIVPRAEVPAVLADLRAVSDAWLEGKAGREKGFSLGRFEDDYLKAFDCAVMRKDGEIVAFANLWRSGDHDELSVDLMRYRPGVSHVLMDALFVDVMLYGKAEGYRGFSLGTAPLSGLSDHPLASTWNRIGTFIYRHGDEFYHFDGLRSFKQKFDPIWTPQYIVCPGGLAMPRALLDVTGLISRNPLRALTR